MTAVPVKHAFAAARRHQGRVGVSVQPGGKRAGIPRSPPSRPGEVPWPYGLMDHGVQQPVPGGGQAPGPAAARCTAAPRRAAAWTETSTCFCSSCYGQQAGPRCTAAHRPACSLRPAGAPVMVAQPGICLHRMPAAALPAVQRSNRYAGEGSLDGIEQQSRNVPVHAAQATLPPSRRGAAQPRATGTWYVSRCVRYLRRCRARIAADLAQVPLRIWSESRRK
jgi:hypothetical protein